MDLIAMQALFLKSINAIFSYKRTVACLSASHYHIGLY